MMMIPSSNGFLKSVILNEATGPNWCDFQMRHYDLQPVTVVRPVVAHLNQNDTGHAARAARARISSGPKWRGDIFSRHPRRQRVTAEAVAPDVDVPINVVHPDKRGILKTKEQ